jgi:phage tail sheath protein FI
MAYDGISTRIEDNSVSVGGAAQKTKFIVQAITERGVPNQPYEVSTELEFVRKLGRAIDKSGFEILRGLKTNDCVFVVFPVHHIVENVAQGTKASVEIGTANFVLVTAKATGGGYNVVQVIISAPRSGVSGRCDITVSIPNVTSQTVQDVPLTLTTDKVEELNQTFELVDFDITDGAALVLGTYTLSGGAKDVSTIVEQDIIDGIASFDNLQTPFFRIMNLIKPDIDVNAEYVTYAENNQKTAIIFAPLGLSKANLIAFRNGTTPYVSSKIDSFHARLVAGGIKCKNPYNSNQTIELLGAGDLAGAIGRKDRQGLWLAAAQYDFGVFSNAIDVVTNFATSDYAELNALGINLITNRQGTIRYNGNNSLFVDRTKSRSSENISDLVLYLQNTIEAFADRYRYKPNTQISIWQPFYVQVRAFIEDLVNRQAIYGGEGSGAGQWEWIGDQNATTISEVQYNTPVGIASGLYRAKLRFTPVSAAEEIELTFTIESGI